MLPDFGEIPVQLVQIGDVIYSEKEELKYTDTDLSVPLHRRHSRYRVILIFKS